MEYRGGMTTRAWSCAGGFATTHPRKRVSVTQRLMNDVVSAQRTMSTIDHLYTSVRRRRGSIYVVVLGVAVGITVIGFGSLAVMRVNRNTTTMTGDFATARYCALAAVEIGQNRIATDPAWRTTYPNGIWEQDTVVGDCTFTLSGVDPVDGDLSNSPTDPLTLTGLGMKGDASFQLSVDLVAKTPPLSSLSSALHAGQDATIDTSTISADAPLTANRNVSAITAAVNTDVEAVGTISGTTYNGTTAPSSTALSVPDATVFDFYVTNGTAISYAALPSGTINEALLSPVNNPYTGVLDPNGVYVINCGGQRVTIENSRIYGTLVLLDVGAGSQIQNSVIWGPVVSNYPSLLVRGDLEINLGNASLNEGALGINLNPPGAPYGGVTDTMIDDTYPSRLNGLFYISGNVLVSKTPTIYGTLIVGVDLSIVSGSTVNVTYDSVFYDNPPSGFQEPPVMEVVPGSWRQVVN